MDQGPLGQRADFILYHARLAGAGVTEMEALLPRRVRPVLANLRLTNRCNAHCGMCRCWSNTDPERISTDRAVTLLGGLADAGILFLRFTGGEPLLRRDLFDILRRAPTERFKRITLASNGLLLPRRVDQINDSAITYVSVSLDGLRETHDRLRGVPGLFDLAVDGLERVHRPVRVGSIFTRALVNDLDELIRFAHGQGWTYDISLPDWRPYFFDSAEIRRSVEELWPTPREVETMLEVLQRHKILDPPLLEHVRSHMLDRQPGS